MNLEEIVIQSLKLRADEPRYFVHCLSGGPDSTVLATLLLKLRKKFSIRLEFFHMNFQLRALDSERDQKFVERFAKKHKIYLHLRRVKLAKKTSIQEQARASRLLELQKFPPEAEVIEAHQLNDQLETFLFRLFRGSGLRGLSGMKSASLREGKKIWRPLLSISKVEILNYAKKQRIRFRTDRSNLKSTYDRNWLRLKLLPLIEKRFPSFDRVGLRLIEEIQALEIGASESLENMNAELQIGQGQWRWPKLRQLPEDLRKRFLLKEFERAHLGLKHQQLQELNKLIEGDRNFIFNAPKGWLLRARRQSHTVKEGYLQLCAPKNLSSIR